MAGVQALVNQNAGSPQGNPNPVYYALAAIAPGAFHSVTQGDIDVNCAAPNDCYGFLGTVDIGRGGRVFDTTSGGALSVSGASFIPAFSAGASWSFAAGIGSVDAFNLVTNWSKAVTPQQFSLTIDYAGTGSGTVTASPAGPSYAAGTVVTLTPAANSGSTFAGWSGACSGTGGCTVTMDSAQSVTATFNLAQAQQFTLTINYAGTGSGTVTASPAGPSYAAGTVVTLTPAANSGSTFAGWSGACSGTGSCSVTMNSNQSVTATFNLAQAQQFTLTINYAGTGSGTATPNPGGLTYAAGTVVMLTQSANTGSTFAGWSGACSGSGSCSVTMSSNQSVTATFNLQQFTLTINNAGTGSGTATPNPGGLSYAAGTVVMLTQSANTGSTFAGWSGACTGTGSCSVTMNSAQSVTATFNLQQFTLTINNAGTGSGTVTPNPSGPTYSYGTVVTLTPAANSGSTFAGWSGACSGTGGCTVTMDSAQSVTATFNLTQAQQFTLTINYAGTGSGTATPNPGGLTYAAGTVVMLTQSANTGSTFAGWSGACTGTGSCSVTMNSNQSVTATFNLQQFTLTINNAGTGSGTVTPNPSGLTYAAGTVVMLTQSANTGSTFAGWSGACTGTGSCSVTMNSNQSVTATFNLQQFTLTINNAGTGSGTVTPNPSGLTYNDGTVVTLTQSANTGSTFAGWSGACAGTGSCSVTMNSNQSVTATFNLVPIMYNLTITQAGAPSTFTFSVQVPVVVQIVTAIPAEPR